MYEKKENEVLWLNCSLAHPRTFPVRPAVFSCLTNTKHCYLTLLALVDVLGAVDSLVAAGAGARVGAVDGAGVADGVGVAWVRGAGVVQVT